MYSYFYVTRGIFSDAIIIDSSFCCRCSTCPAVKLVVVVHKIKRSTSPSNAQTTSTNSTSPPKHSLGISSVSSSNKFAVKRVLMIDAPNSMKTNKTTLLTQHERDCRKKPTPHQLSNCIIPDRYLATYGSCSKGSRAQLVPSEEGSATLHKLDKRRVKTTAACKRSAILPAIVVVDTFWVHKEW